MSLSWKSLNINKAILDVVRHRLAFKAMTAVQSAVIPLFISNKDCAVEAVTGSGKTLAFIIPIIEILMKKMTIEKMNGTDVGAIVVSPTRELAQQIYEVLNYFIETNEDIGLKGLLLIGGNSIGTDIDRFTSNGAHIIVSTPGRLCDMFSKCDVFANKVRKCLEVFVLDEADLILSMGFETALNTILSYLPKQRRTGLFSATLTKKLDQLIRAGLRNPVKVEIKEKFNESHLTNESLQMPRTLRNSYLCIDSAEDKLPLIIDFMKRDLDRKYLLFLSTCAQVNYFERPISKFLRKDCPNYTVLKLHRKLKNKRQKIFDKFRDCKSGVLLCTDVMSRGVDIPQVDWVIHFDLPNTIENYVHRCGRSGHQVGVVGNSLMLTLKNEMEFIDFCRIKGLDLNEYELKLEIDVNLKKQILDFMKCESRSDKNYYEEGMQSFVAFIRTYNSKHCMSTILFKTLDINDLANGYALLKIPSMPELRHKHKAITAFNTSIDDIRIAKKFKDENFKTKEPKERPEKKKGLRRDPKINLKIKKTKLKGKRKKEFVDELDMRELAEDAKMVRKLKNKKISGQEFDKHFGL